MDSGDYSLWGCPCPSIGKACAALRAALSPPRGRPGESRRTLPRFRITSRDREIVRWIGRLRMATAAQVTERFDLGRAVGYARLSGLVRLGLLDHARIFHATPGVYATTRAGLATVDLALPPARVDVRTYDHDLGLSSLVIELETEFGRDRVTTEREMRSVDAPLGAGPRAQPRFAVALTGGRDQLQLTPVGYPRLHFPDCAVTEPGHEGSSLAIELERTPKGRARLRSTFRRTCPAARSVTSATTWWDVGYANLLRAKWKRFAHGPWSSSASYGRRHLLRLSVSGLSRVALLVPIGLVQARSPGPTTSVTLGEVGKRTNHRRR